MGPHITVSTTIRATPEQVWADLRDIGSHVHWMHDAVEIRFLSNHLEGIGTRFECDTRVGPFSLTDVMEITKWEEPHMMGVRHVGIVEGAGVFTLQEDPQGHTTFKWREGLLFPWYMGGPIGATLAAPILRLIWKRNLSNLRARLEA